jgi:outer membrane protein assembly factor BamE (lipoprotein component of BamABCDE complex)
MTHIRSRIVRIAVGLAAAVGALAGVTALTGSAAHADNGTPGCVARAEYRQVRRGMTRPHVTSIFGTRGTQSYVFSGSGGYYSESRNYKACTVQFGVHGIVNVTFHRDQYRQPIAVESKYAIW